MYNVSQRFKDALLVSHNVVAKVDILNRSGAVVLAGLPVERGEVRSDRTSSVRRSCSLELVATMDMVPHPQDTTHPLHPLSGNEFRPYRGIKFGEDDIEWVPQGVYGITSIDVDDGGDNVTLTMRGDDRAREVQIARLTNNYVVPAGTNYATAIEDLIENRRPNRFTFNYAPITAVTPQLVFGGSGETGGGDAWGHAEDMAHSVAHEVFFDLEGVNVLREQPLVGTDPVVWTYKPGEGLLSVSRSISKDDVHNHVIVFGEAADTGDPIRGEDTDDDPASATYVGSPVGTGTFYSPTWLRSEFVRTQAQADELAVARLRQTLRRRQRIQIVTVPNPALEVSDIIRVMRGRLAMDEQMIVESMTMPLKADAVCNIVLAEGKP